MSLLALAPAVALADTTPITDRNFAIDIYQGGVVNGGRTIAMGGANIAAGEGAPGMASNPAAPAVRPATSNDTWDWDWNLDGLVPAVGTDFDNNGGTSTTIKGSQISTGALVGQYRQWGLGISYSHQQYTIDDASGADAPKFEVAHVDLARSFRDGAVTVGVGLRPGTATVSGATISGTGLEAGFLWRPPRTRLRVGFTGALPVTGDTIDAPDCDPLDCNGWILPERIKVPWEIGAGVAWRFAPTPWNQQVTTRWRDEKALILAADVLITGPVDGGAGIEAFLDKRLQPSGRTVSVSVRSGAEYEWRPGRLRVRAGSYFEPGRFEDVYGRVHLTAGLDFRFWQLRLWGADYRLRVSITADGAARYGNAGLSVGLWH